MDTEIILLTLAIALAAFAFGYGAGIAHEIARHNRYLNSFLIDLESKGAPRV